MVEIELKRNKKQFMVKISNAKNNNKIKAIN